MSSEQTSEKQIAISAVLKAIPLCQQVQANMEEADVVQKAPPGDRITSITLSE